MRRAAPVGTFGTFLLSLAIVYTYIGKAWDKGAGWFYRTKTPIQYWLEVAMYYLSGLGFIVIFMYESHVFSH